MDASLLPSGRSSNGTTPHDRLKRRKCKTPRLIALVVCSDGIHQGATAILNVDYSHCPDGKSFLAIGKSHRAAQSKLFLPVVALGIPNHRPKSFKILRVKIDHLPGIAVVWI